MESDIMCLQINTILIFVHTEDKSVHQIEVNENDPIKIIEDKLRSKIRLLLFYNNNILMKGFSFKFYGVTSGDHIYVTGSQSLQAYSNLTKSIGRLQETSARQLHGLKHEMGKIKDMFLRSLESTSLISHCFSSYYRYQSENNLVKDPQHSLLDNETASDHLSTKLEQKNTLEISCY